MGALADSLGMNLILYNETLGSTASEIDLSSFSQVGGNLIIDFAGQTTHTSTANLYLYLGTGSLDTTDTNYRAKQVYNNGNDTPGAQAVIGYLQNNPGVSSISSTNIDGRGACQIRLNNYTDATTRSITRVTSAYEEDDGGTWGHNVKMMAHRWVGAGTVDHLRLKMSTGDIEVGSRIKIYIER